MSKKSLERCLPHQYSVGYGKPPEQHRFKKGVSGNPKGRPKKLPPLFEAMISEELDEIVAVEINGQRQKITKRKAVAKRLVADAAKGDPRAMIKVLEMDLAYRCTLEDTFIEED